VGGEHRGTALPGFCRVPIGQAHLADQARSVLGSGRLCRKQSLLNRGNWPARSESLLTMKNIASGSRVRPFNVDTNCALRAVRQRTFAMQGKELVSLFTPKSSPATDIRPKLRAGRVSLQAF
jgi:hypothetical protein